MSWTGTGAGVAVETAERAAGLARDAGLRVLHGHALTALAAAHHPNGAVEEAVAVGQEAQKIHLDTGHRPVTPTR